MSNHLEDLSHLLQLLSLNPGDGSAWCKVGFTYLKIGEIQEALDTFNSSIQISPRLSTGYYGKSISHFQHGELIAAQESLRTAIQLSPKDQRLYSAYAHLCAASGESPDVTFKAYKEWGDKFSTPLRPKHRPPGRRSRANGCIKVGYISPDFRTHALMSFFAPVLKHHDREKFEIIAFSSGTPDQATPFIREQFDHWNDISKLSDKATADLIRRREIDVLVDLAGHTNGTRLLALAYQPAPAQFTWYGYNCTTGSKEIDFRLTDITMDPEGNESLATEKLIRLPSFACYEPPENSPPVSPLPCDSNGHITFGSLNNPQKLTNPTLQAWATILREVPDARLLIIAARSDIAYDSPLYQRIQSCGLPMNRVNILPYQDFNNFIKLGESIDIALEPFPLSGAVTTCQTLWMGAPAIALAGRLPNERAAAAILAAANLQELIAYTVADYVAFACQLAHNPDRLRHTRKTLRTHLTQSPLMDYAEHVKYLEAAYQSVSNHEHTKRHDSTNKQRRG